MTAKTKKFSSLITVSFLLATTVAQPLAQAHIIFQDDTFQTIESDGIILDQDNDAPGNLIIQFGSILAESLAWNISTTKFDLSDDLNVDGGVEIAGNLDFNLNQALEFRAENLSSAPTCNSGSNGRIYQNTTNGYAYICDGTNLDTLNKKHYQNGTLTQNTITATITGVTTTGGTTSVYLTSDGTVSGTKLFTTVYNVSAQATAIQADTEAPTMAGYSYNSGTGELQIKFLESATILIGGQGLEAEESGTPFSVFAIGI